MVHQSKFVMAIMHDGRPARELSGKVILPFNSEFSVRLKNLYTDYSSTCELFIDGSRVDTFVVGPDQTIDIERFIGNDLSSGRKFKFVAADHPDVADPSNGDNGIVEARFHRAMYPCRSITYVNTPTYIYNNPPLIWTTPSYPQGPSTVEITCSGTTNPTYGNTKGTDSTFGGPQGISSNVVRCMNANINTTTTLSSSGTTSSAFSVSNSEVGATIEGSHSNQSFYTVDSFPVLSQSVILKLRIVGDVNRGRVNDAYCTKCGNPIRHKDRYCAGCGKRIRNK